jgi:hypothetical protein
LKRLKARFEVKAVTQEQLEGQCARAFGMQIGSSSYFQGWTQFKLPLKTWVELLLPLIGTGVLIIILTIRWQGSWLSIPACIFLVLISLSSLRQVWILLHAKNLVSEAVWGWLEDKHFIQGSGCHCVKVSRSDAFLIESDDEWIMISLPDGSQHAFFRTCFSDKDYFDTLRSVFDSHSADECPGSSQSN